MESRSALQSWLAVASIAVGTFAMVTTEFLPIGLLTDIAKSLGVSDGTAGLMVTTPGIVATFAAPAWILAAGKLDRRNVLWTLTVLLIASNVIAALAPSFSILLAGRVLVGICIGGFWTFAMALGRRLVPEESGGRATSIVAVGVSLATVCGVPAATLLGSIAGWRVVFGATAGLAGLVLLAQMTLLPRLPATQAIRAGQLLGLLRIRNARVGLIAVLFTAGGHFAAYTYLKPFLQQVPVMDEKMITAVLFAYGAAGFFGTFFGEFASGRSVRSAYAMTALLLGVVLVLSPAFGSNRTAATVLATLWGLAFGAVPIVVQAWIYKAAPADFESGSALLVSTFQIAIASGALLGGRIVDGFSVSGALLAGGLLTFAAAATMWLFGREDRGSSGVLAADDPAPECNAPAQ